MIDCLFWIWSRTLTHGQKWIKSTDSWMTHNHWWLFIFGEMWNLEWLIFKLITHSEFQKMYRSTPKLLIKKWKIEKFTFVRRKSGRPPTPFGLRDGELTVLNEKVALYQRKNNVRPLISPEIEHLRGVFAIYKPPHTGNYFKYCILILSHVSVISVLELTFSIRLRLWELRCLLMGILWGLCFFTGKLRFSCRLSFEIPKKIWVPYRRR